MKTFNLGWRSRAQLGIKKLGSLAIALAACQAARGGIIPTFNSSTSVSYFNAIHNPGSPGGSTNTVNNNAIATGSPTLTYNNTIPFSGGSTTANAGMAESSGPTTCTVSFASGMGVGQTDPTSFESASSLAVNFTAVWNIVGGTFGPPINGSFSVPVGERIGAGGSGSFACDVHWSAVIGGKVYNDIRAAYVLPTQNYGAGTNMLYSYSAPAAAFSQPLLASGDQFIMSGTLTFTANNDDEPSYVDIPTAQELVDISSLSGQDPTAFDYSPVIETDELPEPASLSLLFISGFALLGRRRRAAR